MSRASVGAQVFWTARLHAADAEPRLASCRYAGLDGMSFVCDHPYARGAELTMFVAALHGSTSTHTGWIEFKLRVTFQSFTDGLCRITCQHNGTSEASMGWLMQALGRLNKRPLRPGVSAAAVKPPAFPSPSSPPAPPARPPGVDAQRRQLRRLLKPLPGATPLLDYDGAFDAPALQQLFATARTALTASRVSPVHRRRLYNGVVELAQNIRAHAQESDAQAPGSAGSHTPLGAMQLLASTHDSDPDASGYSLCAANRIAASSMEGLYAMMQRLRTMCPQTRQEALRALLLEQRSAVGGERQLGFGLLTLAAESAQPLEWSFTADAVEGQQCNFFVVHVNW